MTSNLDPIHMRRSSGIWVSHSGRPAGWSDPARCRPRGSGRRPPRCRRPLRRSPAGIEFFAPLQAAPGCSPWRVAWCESWRHPRGRRCSGCHDRHRSWQDYRDQGVWFIGVDYLDIDSEGLAYLDRFNITYPNAPDIGSRTYEDYRCTGVPETFFIDKDGEIQHVQIGPISQPQLYGLLDGLVAAEP